MRRRFWIVAAGLTLALPALVPGAGLAAGPVLRVNEDAHVPAGREVDDVVVLNGSADIAGRVTGNIVVLRGTILLRPTATVGGDVVCLGGAIQEEAGAIVNGSKVEIGGQIGWRSLPFFSIGKILFWSFLYKLVSAAILLVLAVFVTLMWPNQIRLAAKEAAGDLVRSSLVGVLAVAVLIPLAIGFAVTLFGLPIALALFLFLLVARWFGIATVAYLVGHKLSVRFTPVPAVIIGVLILKIIHFVPFIGGVLYFIATLPGLGAVLLTRFGTNEPWLGAGRSPTVRNKT